MAQRNGGRRQPVLKSHLSNSDIKERCELHMVSNEMNSYFEILKKVNNTTFNDLCILSFVIRNRIDIDISNGKHKAHCPDLTHLARLTVTGSLYVLRQSPN